MRAGESCSLQRRRHPGAARSGRTCTRPSARYDRRGSPVFRRQRRGNRPVESAVHHGRRRHRSRLRMARGRPLDLLPRPRGTTEFAEPRIWKTLTRSPAASVFAAAVLWGTTGLAAAYAPTVSPLVIGAVAMGGGGLLQIVANSEAMRANQGDCGATPPSPSSVHCARPSIRWRSTRRCASAVSHWARWSHWPRRPWPRQSSNASSTTAR